MAGKEVRSYILKEFGDDITQLWRSRELLEDIEKEVETIKSKLSEKRHSLSAEAHGIRRDCDVAIGQANSLVEERFVNEFAALNSHLEQARPLAESVSSLVNQVADLEKCKKYLQWISKVNQLSSAIKECVDAASHSSALDYLENMLHISKTLQTSSCSHLKTWVDHTVNHWHDQLKKKLSSEFSLILESLNWPIITTTKSVPLPQAELSNLQQKLHDSFGYLLRLGQRELAASGADFQQQLVISLPIEMMVIPLRKRFKYHFYGKRPTNVIGKPEWYMRQVMNWLRDHSKFLVTIIQPVMDSLNCRSTAKMEFTKAMLNLAADKFSYDSPKLCEDGNLLSHAVDEILLFHQELNISHDFPTSQLNIFHVLTEERFFNKWLEVEKQNAQQKLKAFVSSPTAWCLQYKDMQDVDEQRVPECAETLMTFLFSIEGRYKYISNFSCQRQFVDLQKEILVVFSDELINTAKLEAKNAISQHFIVLINAANYVLTVVREKADQPFFIAFHKQTCKEMGMDVDGVFSETEVLYIDVKQEMLENLAHTVVDTFKTKSKPYMKEKWQVMASRDGALSLELSSSACDMLATLRLQMEIIHKELAVALFQSFWMHVAEKIDEYLYKEVVCSLFFNEAGAKQLHFDITRNLFLLFSEYTSKPENFFKLTKESCHLLTLLQGSGVLLREVLLTSVKAASNSSADADAETCLIDVGVHKLTRQQALAVLMRRVDWLQS